VNFFLANQGCRVHRQNPSIDTIPDSVSTFSLHKREKCRIQESWGRNPLERRKNVLYYPRLALNSVRGSYAPHSGTSCWEPFLLWCNAMNDEAVCEMCGNPVGHNAPSVNIIKKRFCRVNGNTPSNLCFKCFKGIRVPRWKHKIDATNLGTKSLARIIQSGDYQEFMVALASANARAVKLSRAIENGIANLKNLAAQQSRMLDVIYFARERAQENPRLLYPEARARANKALSDPELRQKVFMRDKCKCVFCGKKDNLTIDHIIPVILGGGDEMMNLQTLCQSCNSRKGSRYEASEGVAS
jgi:hypothetical protein